MALSTYISQLGTALIGLVATAGATIAVCLGHIDSSTYIAIIGPLAGVGVGAGIHSAGTNIGAEITSGIAPYPTPHSAPPNHN